jgi:DEAD/DEAH box helicase domain-containing protein
MKYIFYDTEIIKCIPSKTTERDPNFSYCEGWRDFSNMGISVIGAYLSDDFTQKTSIGYHEGFHSFTNADNSIPGNFPSFEEILGENPIVIGFNSRAFDDELLKANGISIETRYDLLELIRLAAYGSVHWQDQPRGYSYSLDSIAKENGLKKTGSGELAPRLWQKEKRQEVVEYCLHDVAITRSLWDLGLKGNLIDPNTLKELDISPFVEDISEERLYADCDYIPF